ncbi:hypothetical protein [Litoribacillus peritrichatus]|uniref:Scaffolding protein n=1 Tax=Litoribacillus peritrichatus TaxID=718191 RepID=A0ABP7N405_9GAMM
MAITTVNNAVTNTAPVTGNSAGSASTTSATNTSSNSNQEQTSAVESDIRLSSRAKKVQKLNEEFFPGGPSTVKITPEFIERLQEYGFISKAEAESLGAQQAKTGAGDTVGKLSSEIKALQERLRTIDPQDGLLDILEKSDAIISNLDGSKPSGLAADIKTVNAELNAYLNSEQAKKLSETEKETLDELSLALQIADKLNPNNISSQKLNSYLAFA